MERKTVFGRGLFRFSFDSVFIGNIIDFIGLILARGKPDPLLQSREQGVFLSGEKTGNGSAAAIIFTIRTPE